MPWLMERVTDHLEKSQLGRTVLDGLIREVVSQRRDAYERIHEKTLQSLVSEEADNKDTETLAPPAEVTLASMIDTEVCISYHRVMRSLIFSPVVRATPVSMWF